MNAETKDVARQLEAQSLLDQGDAELESGNFNNAEAIFYRCLGMFPGNRDALGKVGHLYKSQDRMDDANMCFRGVIPDAANEHFFDSKTQSKKILSQSVANNCVTLSAFAPQRIALKAPKQHGVSTKYPNFRFTETESLGSFTTCIKHGQVWFDAFNTVVFDRAGHIVQEHTKGNEFAVNLATRDTSPINLQGRVCFLDARSSPIYYHWMLDVLPKLRVLQQSGIELDSIDRFLVRANSSFQLETLSYFGVPKHKIHQLDDNALYSADEMLVPYLKNDLGDKLFYGLGLGLASWIPEFLKELIPRNTPDPDTESVPESDTGSSIQRKRRLFISRQDSQTRCIENESEVNAIFEKYNLETVTFTNLSVVEQAQLMSEAELVVGVHGAGFTNLAFCNEGTVVLELFGTYIVPCYWSLANLIGLDYNNFMCDETIPKTAHDVHIRRDKNIFVDIEKLDATLATLINSLEKDSTDYSSS